MNLAKANRKLTEKQEYFLENLLETKGDIAKAAELAGYSGNTNQVIQSLKQEIVDLAQNILAKEAPKAAFKLVEVMTSDKPMPNINAKLQAAQTLLDRVGVTKQDKVEVNHNVSGGIFILPEKDSIVIDGDIEEAHVRT
tara:strand:+ start:479 stop:895 length:417 start_codon:yes stop_codon:yes gene_type:complete